MHILYYSLFALLSLTCISAPKKSTKKDKKLDDDLWNFRYPMFGVPYSALVEADPEKYKEITPATFIPHDLETETLIAEQLEDMNELLKNHLKRWHVEQPLEIWWNVKAERK